MGSNVCRYCGESYSGCTNDRCSKQFMWYKPKYLNWRVQQTQEVETPPLDPEEWRAVSYILISILLSICFGNPLPFLIICIWLAFN